MLADISELILPVIAALLFARRAATERGRGTAGAAGWAWMSTGALAWAGGQVAWIVLAFGLHINPTVSVATIGFVGWSILTAIGLLRVGGAGSGRVALRPIIAESLILTTSLGFLVWELALA